MSEKLRDFLTHLVSGVIIAAAVFFLNQGRGYPTIQCLCDGCFVAAVFLLGIGGIRSAANQGTFDVVGFGLRSMVGMALPVLNWEKETMEQYRERKTQERKTPAGLLQAGAVYLILSLVTYFFYCQIYE